MYVLSPLSEEVPVRKDPLFGQYFDRYGAKYVKKSEKWSKIALINGPLLPLVYKIRLVGHVGVDPTV